MLNIQTIKIKDLEFEVVISEQDIQQKVREQEKLTKHYKGQNPLLIGVLNGSFVFLLTYATKP